MRGHLKGPERRWVRRVGLFLLFVCLSHLELACALGRRSGDQEESERGPKKFQRELELADVDPRLAALAGTRLNALEREPIYFGEVGMPGYDEVCLNAAVAYASLKMAQTMVADAQENLVKFARDHVARGEVKRQIQELKQETRAVETEAGTEPDAAETVEPEWSAEEAAYVIKEAKRQKGRFTRDEVAYFGAMSLNLAVAGYVLAKGVQSEVELARRIPELIGSAREDFRGPDALKIPFVLQNLNQARKHLQALPLEGKQTTVDVARYARIVKELHEETKDLTPVD